MEESWKAIAGFPGYDVSDMGRVRSYWRKKGIGRGTMRVMEDSPQMVLKTVWTSNKGGLPIGKVALCRGGEVFQRQVSRLVLEAFVGPCPDGMECCHGPNGPRDNSLGNLSWGTHLKNCRDDRIRDGTIRNSGRPKLRDEQVMEIRAILSRPKSDRPPGFVTYEQIGGRYGVAGTTIFKIKTGTRWTHL